MMMMMMVILNGWPVGRADSDQGRDVPTQAGALHGTVQALVQFVTISLQYLCCIHAIFVHSFCNIMCNISAICLFLILMFLLFSHILWKRGTLFLEVYFPSALCSSSCVKFCPILWGLLQMDSVLRPTC